MREGGKKEWWGDGQTGIWVGRQVVVVVEGRMMDAYHAGLGSTWGQPGVLGEVGSYYVEARRFGGP